MNVSDYYTEASGFSNEKSFCDWCLGQSVQALVDDGKEETAVLMLACRLSWRVTEAKSFHYFETVPRSYRSHEPTIFGPMNIIRQLQPQPGENSMGDFCYVDSGHMIAFEEVLSLVLGKDFLGKDFGKPSYSFQVETSDLPLNWRQELLEIARKKGTTNQGLAKGTENVFAREYANLRFRSQSEVRIAQAFDRHKVMYFANCTARVNLGQDRVNREPDFLVCHEGRWGILEVDGKDFHPPTRTSQDHDRDRLFEKHGVRFVQHYDAKQCYEEPDQVVVEFLGLLSKNG